MLIRQAHLHAIASGTVSLAFRRWRVPTVKAGGTLRTPIGVLAIDAVDVVRESDITDAEAIGAGYASKASLLAELARRSGQTYRIRLRLAGPDPRLALRERSSLSSGEQEQLLGALARLDRYSKRGPWCETTLEAIASHPGRRAAQLADDLGWEKDWLKTSVRKLKELGLTASLETGYRLSPRGLSAVAMLRRRRRQP